MKKIVLTGLLLAAKTIMAQTAATNTGVLYVSGSTVLSAASDFANNSGSALTNNGQLYIQGALTNNQSSMAVGTGTLYLNGSTAQTVNGAQPFRTYNFVSDNSAGITLVNNLHVSGAHTFTNGDVLSPAPYYLVYESGSSYSGTTDAKHVIGWVKKLGTTNFIFPVGNDTILRTVALVNLSVSSEFNVTYNAGNPPSMLSTQLPIRFIDPFEYWSINKTSGGTAQVTMNWDRSKRYFPNWIVPDIVTAGFNGTVWTDNGGTASGNAATTGTITSSVISTFNMFTFGSKSWVLPVNLIDFTAKRQDNHTQIDWKAAAENNLSHYIVERSDDGTSFYSIGQVSARNSGIEENYQKLDPATIHNIAYYRLRCVDIDRKEILSRTVTVSDANGGDLVLLNNPVLGQIKLLAGSALKGNFQYQLTMMNGQLVQQGTITIQAGGKYEIPVNVNIHPGTYILKVSDQLQTFNYKLVVI